MLKGQDIVVALKAHLWPEVAPWSYERLARSVGLSASQAHASLVRMAEADLYRAEDRTLRVYTFLDFVAYGVPHVFPGAAGAVVRGLPTSHAAPALVELQMYGDPYVWADDDGVLGRGVKPLHPCVPRAARADRRLYAALAAIDAFRVGRARDRAAAREVLEHVLAEPGHESRWLAECALAQ